VQGAVVGVGWVVVAVAVEVGRFRRSRRLRSPIRRQCRSHRGPSLQAAAGSARVKVVCWLVGVGGRWVGSRRVVVGAKGGVVGGAVVGGVTASCCLVGSGRRVVVGVAKGSWVAAGDRCRVEQSGVGGVGGEHRLGVVASGAGQARG